MKVKQVCLEGAYYPASDLGLTSLAVDDDFEIEGTEGGEKYTVYQIVAGIAYCAFMGAA
jgi:hypothetical protein